MWIVQLTLRRPDTVVVMALLILVPGGTAVRQSRTDIFPVLDIPVVTVVWSYRGVETGDLARRVTTCSECGFSSNFNDIRRMELQPVSGVAVMGCAPSFLRITFCSSRHQLPSSPVTRKPVADVRRSGTRVAN